jgi:hypothetical protein
MSDLGLKPQEAAVLFNIIERCWKAGDKAWPSVGYLATNIGRKDSATRAITSSLAKKGFLDKEQRYNTTNLYDLEPLAEKLAEHMSQCRHTARKLEGYSQKSSSLDSQKTSDYIEPVTKTNKLDPLYSHIVNNNDDDSDIDDIKSSNSEHPCMTSKGIKHDWDEPFEVEQPMNKNGETHTWEYKKCLRCGDMYHTKLKYEGPDREPDNTMEVMEEHEAIQKADWRDSWDYKDYIEPFIYKTHEEEALISQFTKETENRIPFLEWVENAKNSYSCLLELDEDVDDYEEPHIWETYEGERSVNQFGEEMIWIYWHCTRCNESFHRKISIDVLNNYVEYEILGTLVLD